MICAKPLTSEAIATFKCGSLSYLRNIHFHSMYKFWFLRVLDGLSTLQFSPSPRTLVRFTGQTALRGIERGVHLPAIMCIVPWQSLASISERIFSGILCIQSSSNAHRFAGPMREGCQPCVQPLRSLRSNYATVARSGTLKILHSKR